MKIAVLDDMQTQDELLPLLARHGHCCDCHDDAGALLSSEPLPAYHLLLFTWRAETAGAVERLRQAAQRRIPAVALMPDASDEAIGAALAAGADDFMCANDLVALAGNLITTISRYAPVDDHRLSLGHVSLDWSTRSGSSHGRPVQMTARDFELAWYMAQRCGRVLSRRDLLRDVWGVQADLDTRTVDVHVSRIRKRLDLRDDGPLRIRTLYRQGYVLEYDI